MNGHQTTRTRLPLRTGSVMALAAGLWTLAPSGTAQAAETTGVTQAQAELRERMEARRQATTRIIAERLAETLSTSAARAEEVRARMELLVTWGYGFEGLMLLDPSTFESPESDAPAEPERPRRFEYDDDTNDPLAGVL